MKLRSLVVVALLAALFTLVPASPASAANTYVATWMQLTTAINAGDNTTLAADITADGGDYLGIPVGPGVVLDLNGHHLTISTPPSDRAAVDVRPGAALTITDSSAATPGILDATGGWAGAGIGGSDAAGGGAITITGGTINATGGTYGAGIGGGFGGSGEDITITGGTINATGGIYAAGIGGGNNGTVGDIIVNGGAINATGGSRGAGIGGGAGFSSSTPTVIINGGTITATGGSLGAGIGGGDSHDGGSVSINGGAVSATGGTAFGAGIGGGGLATSGGTLEITGVAASGSATHGGSADFSVGATVGSIAGAPGRGYHAVASSGTSPATFSVEFGWLVTYDPAGGTPAPGTQIGMPTATEPTAPTRVDYTFTGWNGPSGAWDFSDPVTGGLTLTAQWTAVLRTVTFDSAGGSTVAAATVSQGDPATRPADPTRAGYTFTGWTGPGGTAWDFATPITADTTLTATWTQITTSVGGSSLEGGTLTVTVSGLAPNATHTVRIVGTDSTPMTGLSTLAAAGATVVETTATTDGTGRLTASLVLPVGSAGGATLQIVDPADTIVASSAITIAAPAMPTAAPAPTQVTPTQTGSLPTTGAQTLVMVTIAGLLLALGLGALLISRRTLQPAVVRTET